MSNKIKDELKEEILKEIEEKLEEFQNRNNSIIAESNKIIEENKRIFECFLQQKYQLDKLESLEKVVNKCNDSLVSHEIRISNNKNEIGVIKTKYDKIVLDNLYIQGFIGPSCQYKNLASYIKNSVSEFSKMKIENENIKRETKDFKVKLETATKNVTNLMDGGVLRCNNYTDNRINDFHMVLENKIKELGEKNMDLRMKNIQFQSKLEQQLKDLKNEFEEIMLKQKEEISQMLNNKIEHLNMSLLSLDKNPKFIELDEIKNKSNQLEKDIKEIKQHISKGGEININQDQRLRRVKKRSVMYENENINGIFEHIKNNYLNIRKSNVNSNVNIVSNNSQNINNKFGSSSKLYYLENDKNNNLNENSPRYERKSKNKQQTLSPIKSKFHNESSANIILNNNINNNVNYVNNANKLNLSSKLLNNSKSSNNNNEEYYNKMDINKSKSIPKKHSSKSNVINMKDKIVSKDIFMNRSKTIENNNNNSGGSNNKNKSTNINKSININKNININNEIIKNISSINHSKIKNNNYNLTNPITEDSNSFLSITNSSKDEDIINNTYNKTSNDLNTKTKLLFLNKKNNIIGNNISIISNNISNIQDQKIPLNIMNKLEKNHLYLNKIKSLNQNMELDYNDSRIKSKINYNKSQSNYREEIVKEFFTKYDKGNMTINLNQIKNKGNLDLYNYSISPPDNKFIGRAKINEIIESPFNKDIFFHKNNIIETNNLKHYYTKRNLSVKPSLNMQLYYGNYNMKKKEKRNKDNYLSNSNINGKNKHNIFGKTIYSDYVNKEDLFTMTSYKKK